MNYVNYGSEQEQTSSPSPPLLLSSLLHKQQQEIFALHQQGIQAFEQGDVEASKHSFNAAFSSMNNMLRQPLQEGLDASGFFYPSSYLVPAESGSGELEFTSDFGRLARENSDQEDDQEQAGAARHMAFSSENSSSTTTSSIPAFAAGAVLTKDNKKNVLLLPHGGGSLPLTTPSAFAAQSALLRLPEQVTINQLTFISLYNLAMTTHLAALFTGDSGSMRQALKLWGIVYSLPCRTHFLRLGPRHALTLLVNIGHASSVLGQNYIDRTHQCGQQLLSAIQSLEARQVAIPRRSFFWRFAIGMLMTTTNTVVAHVAASAA